MANEGLSLVFEFSEGHRDLEVDVGHPLVAPVRRAIEEGMSPGVWSFLLVAPSGGLPQVLGSFARTTGGRLLFFPGAETLVTRPNREGEEVRLDHLTLDAPSRQAEVERRHVTVRLESGERDHFPEETITFPRDHLVPWFSLLATTLDGFLELPRRVVVRFDPSTDDVDTFGKHLKQWGGAALIALDDLFSAGTFVQFDFWVGRESTWRAKKSRPLAWAYKPELVSSAPEGSQDITVRSLEFDLGPGVGIRVLASTPTGVLVRSPLMLLPQLAF